MWQKFSLKQQLRINDSLVLRVGLCSASFCDEIKSILLRLNHLGEFETRPQCLFHLCAIGAIKTDPVEDLLVA
jgi:hypothetical protein